MDFTVRKGSPRTFSCLHLVPSVASLCGTGVKTQSVGLPDTNGTLSFAFPTVIPASHLLQLEPIIGVQRGYLTIYISRSPTIRSRLISNPDSIEDALPAYMMDPPFTFSLVIPNPHTRAGGPCVWGPEALIINRCFVGFNVYCTLGCGSTEMARNRAQKSSRGLQRAPGGPLSGGKDSMVYVRLEISNIRGPGVYSDA